jgi:hypothetical protein
LTGTTHPVRAGEDLGDFDQIAQRIREAIAPHLFTPSARALRAWVENGTIGRYRVGSRVYISFDEVWARLEPRRMEPHRDPEPQNGRRR